MTIEEAIPLVHCEELSHAKQPVRWADLGCGSGLFSQALASLLPAGSLLYAVDKNLRNFSANSSSVNILPIQADFLKDNPDMLPLNGILMANALHYVKDKKRFLDRCKAWMHPPADFLLVEYDTDQPLPPWVPYPLSFDSLHALFEKAGYRNIRKIGSRPSRYGHGEIYSAYLTAS